MTTPDRKDRPEAPSPPETTVPEARKREADMRRQRLAAALRENLKRRKAQARTKRGPGEDHEAGRGADGVSSPPQGGEREPA